MMILSATPYAYVCFGRQEGAIKVQYNQVTLFIGAWGGPVADLTLTNAQACARHNHL